VKALWVPSSDGSSAKWKPVQRLKLGEAPVFRVEMESAGGALSGSRKSFRGLLWKSKDVAMEAELRRTYRRVSAKAQRRKDVEVVVRQKFEGEEKEGDRTFGYLEMEATSLFDGVSVSAIAASPLQFAQNPSTALTEKEIGEAIGPFLTAAEGSAGPDSQLFNVTSVAVQGVPFESGLFLPKRQIKALRRDVAVRLQDAVRARAGREARTGTQAQDGDSEVYRKDGEIEGADSENVSNSQSREGNSSCFSVVPCLPVPHRPDSESASELLERGAEESQDQHLSLRPLCRTRAQVDAALRIPWLREIALDFLEVFGLKEAVKAVKAAGKRAIVATPRILKPAEEKMVSFFLSLKADSLLVRSSGMLRQLQELGERADADGSVQIDGRAIQNLQMPSLEADFSLNVANPLAAFSLLQTSPKASNGHSALSGLTPAHDLSAPQICELATVLKRFPWEGGPRAASAEGEGEAESRTMAQGLEVVAHQHLPVFHTEHCVFCRFLTGGKGNNYTDCGHPCERSNVHLRDMQGKDHLVLADMGCRNTVFNAEAQSCLPFLGRLVRAGVRRFRVEFVDEPAEVVEGVLSRYRSALRHAETASERINAEASEFQRTAMERMETGNLEDSDQEILLFEELKKLRGETAGAVEKPLSMDPPLLKIWRWLADVPDSNSRRMGVSLGSFSPQRAEKSAEEMKRTAAELKSRGTQGTRNRNIRSSKNVSRPDLGCTSEKNAYFSKNNVHKKQDGGPAVKKKGKKTSLAAKDIILRNRVTL